MTKGKKKNWLNRPIVFQSLRHDGLDTLFEKSPIRQEIGKVRMPLIVISPNGKEITTVRSASDLYDCDLDCWVIAIWPGKKRSDPFRFTVGQFLEHVKEHKKTGTQVI